MFFILSFTNVPRCDLPSTNAIFFVTVHRHSKPACHTTLCSVAIEPDVINLLWLTKQSKKTRVTVYLIIFFLPFAVHTFTSVVIYIGGQRFLACISLGAENKICYFLVRSLQTLKGKNKILPTGCKSKTEYKTESNTDRCCFDQTQ